MACVAVVGAGLGGLAAAIRLAQKGHEVTVYEKNETAGGKLASRSIDGFTFDIGPSLLTMPQYFDELGVKFSRFRLAHPYRYLWPDGAELLIDDDESVTVKAFDAFARKGGNRWIRAIRNGLRIWKVSERTFFAGPMTSPLSLLRRMRSPSDFGAIDARLTLHQRSKKIFRDPRLQQWLDRYATYSGSSPFKAPATLSCIPYLEQRYGCWHVPGGLATITAALLERASELGVTVLCDSPVRSIQSEAGRVKGVTLEDGTTVDADIVVANVDATVLYETLLPTPAALKRVRRAPLSTAGFAMVLGLSGRTPKLRHHNIWFSSDYKLEFEQIESNGVADEPTIYVCCSSITTKSEAPNKSENWFVLVNVKAGADVDWTTYGDRIIDRLGVRNRIKVREDLTPQFYADRYGSPGGAIYGTSSDGRQAAFLRANNRGAVKGLYLVGGSAHPGGGIPLVLSSARIVCDMVEHDFR